MDEKAPWFYCYQPSNKHTDLCVFMQMTIHQEKNLKHHSEYFFTETRHKMHISESANKTIEKQR